MLRVSSVGIKSRVNYLYNTDERKSSANGRAGVYKK